MKTTQLILTAILSLASLYASPSLAGKKVPPLTVSKQVPRVAMMPLRKDKTLKADYILVIKNERRMILYKKGQPIAWYDISLGGEWFNMLFGGAQGAKQVEGDFKTPEGRYVINAKNANSSFHKALQISYPDAIDEANAEKLGQDPGGEIMIHGMPNNMDWLGSLQTLQTLLDWTAGCIALTDVEIDEVYSAVNNGTTIDILP